jgi:very-short-patch-repair endonuclease
MCVVNEHRSKLDVSVKIRSRRREAARLLRQQQTKSERLLWEQLRNRQLRGRKFRRQQQFGPFVVDFYCVSERLVVEIDGAIHDEQREADAERQRIIQLTGDRVVRLTAELVESNMAEALRRIESAFGDEP